MLAVACPAMMTVLIVMKLCGIALPYRSMIIIL